VVEAVAALPLWLQQYLEWHAHKRSSYDENTKFVVLACLKSQRCGGLSDRLKSIPYFLKLANATNRVFLIKWGPSDLENFLVPPTGGLDWTVPRHWGADFYSRNSCITKEKHSVLTKRESEEQRTKDIRSSDKRVVCVYSQDDLYNEVKQDFATEAQPYGTYADTFRALFEPSTALAAQIDNIMANILGDSLRGNIYLAAQIRSAYPFHDKNHKGLIRPSLESHPNEVRGWADNAVRSVIRAYTQYLMSANATMIPASQKILPVYVTSDRPSIVEYLKFHSPFANASSSTTTFPSIKIIGLESMKRPHVQRNVENATDLFPAFIDLFILAGSSCVSYGMGGYGIFGARLAGEQCLVQHRIRGWH
jgi:hypothetical protein